MTKTEDYDFIGSYDNQRISPINAERSINLFEYMDPQGKRPKVLISTSGLIDSGLSFSPETGGSRATFVFNGGVFQVFGPHIYFIHGTVGSLLKSLVGTLGTSSGYVGVDANQYQVIFVDGVNGYIYDINAATFVQITDTGFPAAPIDVTYLDGFFVVANGGTNNFQLSAFNQGMVWSGASATYTASASTNILTLSTSNANFQTGVPVTISASNSNDTFTSTFGTDIITLSSTNANYSTGTPVTLTTTSGTAKFSGNAATDILTLNVSNEHFQTGTKFQVSTTGTLPNPLVAATDYYAIMQGSSTDNPGQIKVATSYANALANIAQNLTTDGSPDNTITWSSLLPTPLIIDTVYYTIAVSSPSTSPGTIKLATTLANALANTPINITDDGAPINHISTYNSIPEPLEVGVTYYVIMVGTSATNPGTIKLALSYDDAIAGTAIDILTNGSAVNTITVSGQLQLGSITSHPGTIVACNTLHRRLFLFSENFTEVWENAGLGTNLPFRRNNSLLMEVGTPSIASVSVGFDRMFFLAQDRDGLAGVMEVRGTESVAVSNRALDYQLAQYAAGAGVSDARGILIKENGLIFYRLNFTASNHTFVLNVSMSTVDSPKWHEEEVLNGDRHPAQTHAYFDGANFYGDYNKALFYLVSDQTPTNNNEKIRRVRIGRQMTPEGYKRLRIDRWQLDLLQGSLSTGALGFTNTPGLDNILTIPYAPNAQPTVYLSYSKDGGQTYGNALNATMGKEGERTHRTVWRKLGTTPRGQGFVPMIEFYAEIPFYILGAAWAYEVLPE